MGLASWAFLVYNCPASTAAAILTPYPFVLWLARVISMLWTNLGNQVRQTLLPKWKLLIPLFEAVMNSFRAIHDARRRASPSTASLRRRPLVIVMR